LLHPDLRVEALGVAQVVIEMPVKDAKSGHVPGTRPEDAAGEDAGLAGRQPVLGQHDVAVVETAGSELVGRVAAQVFDALAREQCGSVFVRQGPVAQSRKVPHERFERHSGRGLFRPSRGPAPRETVF
jgi:hypothetical protein